MWEVVPKYEVIVDDLINHDIGEFLKSRDFKVLLIKLELHDLWDQNYEMVKKERGFFSADLDHVKYDLEDTLKTFFNLFSRSSSLENSIIEIIISFINNYEEETDFSDILESVKLSNFSDESCLKIQKSISYFNRKEKKNKNTIKNSIIIENAQKDKIFIVHGHNNELKLEVEKIINKLGIQSVILHEQPNGGKTIIEKFEKYSDVHYAVVILTADDIGKSKMEDDYKNRARQNVIFELGYFIGKLGRDNVMALCDKDIEIHSDISGFVYTEIDKNGYWKNELIRELRENGFKIDANKII